MRQAQPSLRQVGSVTEQARRRAEAGLTIVEMLVALVLIGIVFAGVSTALINSSRITVNNERRVQATAMLNALHEELQALPWDLAGLYGYEVEAADPDLLSTLGIDPVATPVMFEGEQVVLFEDPNTPCDPSEPFCNREPLVPELFTTRSDLGDIDYEVVTVVTFADDVGEGQVAKRFTTIVSWEVLGRTVEQRFQSVRSPTAAELEEFGLPTPLFNVAPTVVGLDDDGFTVSEIDLLIDFTGPVDSVSVTYERLEVDGSGDLTGGTETVSVGLTQVVGSPAGVSWEGSILSGEGPFEEGGLQLTMTATRGLETVSSERVVTLVPQGEVVGAPTVEDSVTAIPATVEVGTTGASADRLCQDLVITAQILEYDPLGTVTVTFDGDGGTGRTMTVAIPNPSGLSEAKYTFEAGDPSPWNPTASSKDKGKTIPAEDVTVEFRVQAFNEFGEGSNIESSPPITVTRKTGAC